MRIAWFIPFDADAPESALVERVAAAFAVLGHAPVIFRPGAEPAAGAVEVKGWRDWREAGDYPLSFHSFKTDAQSCALACARLASRAGVAVLHGEQLESAALGAAAETRIGEDALGAAAVTSAQRERLAQTCAGPIALLTPPQAHEAVEAYASGLMSLGLEALAVAPLTRTARVLAARLADMATPAGDALVGRVGRAATELFAISARAHP